MMTRLMMLVSALLLLGGCATVKYSALEKVGVHKRDILVDRVEEAQDAQRNAKEEITSAYEQFTSLVNVDGGELERTYKKLNGTVQDTRESVADVDRRIAAIERVAENLFEEWQEELEQYSTASLRRSSEQKLRDTRARYQTMLASMKNARRRIDPVLNVFEDQVLFLKHNLNARAVAALKGEAGSIGSKVDVLIRDMNKAIAEADRFIGTMK